MATKSPLKNVARSVARPSKPARGGKPVGKKARLSKSTDKPRSKSVSRKAPAAAISASRKGSSTVARGGAASSGGSGLLKLFIQGIGPTFPSGKVLNADGVAVAPTSGEIQVMQVAPRPDRMSWIYTTVGIAATPAAKHSKPYHLELSAHWKVRDPKSAARILTTIAKHTLDNGIRLNAGDVVTSDATMDLRVDGIQHWLVCPPDRSTPSPVKVAGGNVQILVLLGITEDELQMGLRVRPEIANGRQVLLEAMRTGGVYPVSDPARGCMTRRRDFHRVWEGAFRSVREKHGPVPATPQR